LRYSPPGRLATVVHRNPPIVAPPMSFHFRMQKASRQPRVARMMPLSLELLEKMRESEQRLERERLAAERERGKRGGGSRVASIRYPGEVASDSASATSFPPPRQTAIGDWLDYMDDGETGDLSPGGTEF